MCTCSVHRASQARDKGRLSRSTADSLFFRGAQCKDKHPLWEIKSRKRYWAGDSYRAHLSIKKRGEQQRNCPKDNTFMKINRQKSHDLLFMPFKRAKTPSFPERIKEGKIFFLTESCSPFNHYFSFVVL